MGFELRIKVKNKGIEKTPRTINLIFIINHIIYLLKTKLKQCSVCIAWHSHNLPSILNAIIYNIGKPLTSQTYMKYLLI